MHDQLVRRFFGQFGGGAGDCLRLFQVKCGIGLAPQFPHTCTPWVVFEPLTEGCAECAAGADHQGAVAVAQGGHGERITHWFSPPDWRRKNNVTWPISTPNLDMRVRLISVSSSIWYIQSSMFTS